MAKKGGKGKGWIRLMRVFTWVIFVVMLAGGVIGGIMMMSAGETTQNMISSGALSGLDAETSTTLQVFSKVGKAGGIASIAFFVVFSVIFLAAMNVWLDMAENVRRISGKLSRRLYEDE